MIGRNFIVKIAENVLYTM